MSEKTKRRIKRFLVRNNPIRVSALMTYVIIPFFTICFCILFLSAVYLDIQIKIDNYKQAQQEKIDLKNENIYQTMVMKQSGYKRIQERIKEIQKEEGRNLDKQNSRIGYEEYYNHKLKVGDYIYIVDTEDIGQVADVFYDGTAIGNWGNYKIKYAYCDLEKITREQYRLMVNERLKGIK